MNSKGFRRLITEAVIILVLSVVFVLAGIYLSSFRKSDREQSNYRDQFASVLKCSSYDVINTPILDDHKNIKTVYIGYDSQGTPKGYVVDVMCSNDYSEQLHLLVGIDYESAIVTGVERINDEQNPVKFTGDVFKNFTDSIIGRRIPMAFSGNVAYDDSEVEHEVVINGLHDGVYYAQSMVKDSSGYIDYVEIEVKSGTISRVRWDAVNVDPTTEDRSEASLSGAYRISGLDWATQSYKICHALIEVQNPDLINMKSDGTTSVVEGVTCNIRQFIKLSKECISYANDGYRKSDYLRDFDVVLSHVLRGTAESLHLTNDDGFIVISFDKHLNSFEIKNKDGVVIELKTIRQLSAEYNKDKDSTDTGDKDDKDTNFTPTPTPAGGSEYGEGAEDGVVNPNDPNSGLLTDSIDDLPMSEIASFIDAIPGAGRESVLGITCINTCYKFMKDYLNWLV